MQKIEETKLGNKDILYFDLGSFKSNEEFVKIIARAKEAITSYARASVYTVTNIEGILFDTETKKLAAEWMSFNEPYVVNAAIVGVDGIKKMMMQAVLKLSGRTNARLFFAKEEAYEWLASLK